jgi:hypothetical protein
MIIGICGLIGSGKGTVADILVDQGFKKVSFADKLKDGVSTIFGWDRAMLEGDTDESRKWREQPDDFWTNETKMEVTPRLVLQLFGTDCMRNGFDDGVWVSLLKKTILDNPGNYVVPDVRFENEIAMLRDIGGEVWEVQRGRTPEWLIKYEITGAEPAEIHPSEWRWIKSRKDVVIENNSTLAELNRQVLSHLGAIPF